MRQKNTVFALKFISIFFILVTFDPIFCRIALTLKKSQKSPVFPLNKPMRQPFSNVPFCRIDRSSQSGINDHQNNATFSLRY